MSVLRNTTLQHSVVLYTYHKSFKLSSTHAKFTHVGPKLSHGGAVFCWTVNATLRWITQNVLPAYNYPIQATGQDSCRVITMVTPTKTYILQQCTATTQTETSVQERNPNASAEIVIGRFNIFPSENTGLWYNYRNFAVLWHCPYWTLKHHVIQSMSVEEKLSEYPNKTKCTLLLGELVGLTNFQNDTSCFALPRWYKLSRMVITIGIVKISIPLS